MAIDWRQCIIWSNVELKLISPFIVHGNPSWFTVACELAKPSPLSYQYLMSGEGIIDAICVRDWKVSGTKIVSNTHDINTRINIIDIPACSGLFNWHGLTFIPAWISNYMSGKLWGEITSPFLNFNGATVEVWKWISSFILHFIIDVITYPCWGLS